MHYIQTHGFEVLIIYFIFSVLVSQMPPPKPNSVGYAYLYNVLHSVLQAVAANWNKLGLKMFSNGGQPPNSK
jgi:hypothetical protein